MARVNGTTKQRGYAGPHTPLRQQALAAFIPGQPCARCHQPMHDWPHRRNKDGRYTCSWCDLGHVDGTGKTIYAGLEHRRCNRAANARATNALLNATWTWGPGRRRIRRTTPLPIKPASKRW